MYLLLFCSIFHWLKDCFTEWLINGWIDWLIDWLIKFLIFLKLVKLISKPKFIFPCFLQVVWRTFRSISPTWISSPRRSIMLMWSRDARNVRFVMSVSATVTVTSVCPAGTCPRTPVLASLLPPLKPMDSWSPRSQRTIRMTRITGPHRCRAADSCWSSMAAASPPKSRFAIGLANDRLVMWMIDWLIDF